MKRFVVATMTIVFFLVAAFECSFRGASKTEVISAKTTSGTQVQMKVINTSGEPLQLAHYNVRQTQKTGIAQDPLVTTWEETVVCQFEGGLAPGDTSDTTVCGPTKNTEAAADEVFLTSK